MTTWCVSLREGMATGNGGGGGGETGLGQPHLAKQDLSTLVSARERAGQLGN